MLRLFFALPCPPAIAVEIDAWRSHLAISGRPVPSANLHLTLAFLGDLPERALALLEALPPRLPLRDLAFDLQLDHLDCWHGGLLHLAPSQPPAELLALASGLARLLDEAGLASEPRTYRPHLTLARDSCLPVQVGSPHFAWRAEELVLYRSEQGRYRPLAKWPLG
jgi:2'-5' RNA ligase